MHPITTITLNLIERQQEESVIALAFRISAIYTYKVAQKEK
jgi:hypothetical protein